MSIDSILPTMPDEHALEERIARLEQLISENADRTKEVDTQVDALEQALHAIEESRKNHQDIRFLDNLYRNLNRKLNAIASVATGAGLIWQGNNMELDVTTANDRLGEWMMIAGVGIVAFGVSVLVDKQDTILSMLQTLNPWKRND